MARNTSNQLDDSDTKRKIKGRDLKKSLQIFRFVLPYRLSFGIGMLFLIVSTLTSLTFPYLAGQLLDSATKKTEYSIDQIFLTLIVILIVQAVFSFGRLLLFVRVSEKAMKDIRLELYGKMVSLPISFFEKRRVGELISRLSSDVTQLQDVLSFTLAEFFRQIATLLIGITILLFTSVQLTLLMVSTFPVLVVVAIVFGRYIRKLSKKTQDALADSNVIVEETFQSIQSVKSFTNELFEIFRYENSLHKVIENALKTARLRGFFVSFIIFGLFGAIILVLWFGAGMVETKQISVGELTSFIIYTAFIGGAVGGMGELYAQLQRTVGASERILEILTEPSEVDTKALISAKKENKSLEKTPIKGNIRFDQVHFSYPTREDIEVLKGVSFEIQEGQKIALVGYSGAGKSTIIQLLGRYYTLAQGSITIDGLDINDYNITDLRKSIGTVPQEVILFGGTIGENISYGKPDATQEEIASAAKKANALNFIESFPSGFDTLVGERGIKLSGGQRQRIAIARAILKDPSILILDEATNALDAESEQLVQEALDELMKDRTTIIIAHRLATVRKADRIYVINDGKITESGTHEELSDTENGIYSNLVKLQFETEV